MCVCIQNRGRGMSILGDCRKSKGVIGTVAWVMGLSTEWQCWMTQGKEFQEIVSHLQWTEKCTLYFSA